jgi:hypothetical protein
MHLSRDFGVWPAVLGLLALTLASCSAEKAKFSYHVPWAPTDDISPKWSKAEVYVLDRRGDRGLDTALTLRTDVVVGEAIVAELAASGLVDELVLCGFWRETSRHAYLEQGVDLEVVTTLHELRWEIENYGLKHAATTGVVGTAAVLGGAAGALLATAAVAATEMDVNGHAKIDVRWADLRFDRSFQRSYAGHCETEFPTLEADGNEAKSKVTACALGAALSHFRRDVPAFAAEAESPLEAPPVEPADHPKADASGTSPSSAILVSED